MHGTATATAVASFTGFTGISVGGAGLSLPGGATARVRPIRHGDRLAVGELIRRVSPRTKHLRFLAEFEELPADELARMVELNPDSTLGLVVEHDHAPPGHAIIGLGHLLVDRERRDAEVALLIDDAYQRHGLGHALMAGLLDAARRCEALTVSCQTLMENHAMRHLFQQFADGPIHRYVDPPDMFLSFTLDSSRAPHTTV